MESTNIAGILLLLSLVATCKCGSYCGRTYEYCENGCCDEDCCGGLSTTQIVGLIFGALIGIATLVGCIICIYWMCKNASYDRHAVQPYHNSNAVYVHNNPYGHPRPGAPPSYGEHYNYPARSSNPYYNNYNDPVYPPGVVTGNQPSESPYHPPPSYTAATRNNNNNDNNK